METEIIRGRSGGFGIEYNGGAATMIKELKVEWKQMLNNRNILTSYEI